VTLSRRSFLSFAGGATLAAVGSSTALAGPAAAASSQPRTASRSRAALASPPLLRSTFAAALGSTVRMSASAWSADVVLDSVDDLRGAHTSGEEHRFGLILRADRAVPTDAGVFRLSSRQIGTFDLFVAPVDLGRIAHYYQVVVNPAP
jgi:hypothetical protein